MQPLSNRPITSIFADTPDERALNDGDSPIAESTDAPPLTNSGSETRDSSGIAEGLMSSAEIPLKADALITMYSDDFQQKLNSRTLPDRPILVTGDLKLTDDDALANLSAGLTVGGGLDLRGCTSLTFLPEGLNVGRNLSLKDCTSLRSLSERLTVGGNLDLRHCTLLMSLPTGITVGGGLNLEGCTSLTSLPEGLTVGGNLDLRDCLSLTSLPTGLTVGGGLDFEGCRSLMSLPEGLTVRGDLILRFCRSLTSLPEGLTVCGGLYFHGCRSLTSLPERLSLGGHLDLSHCTSLTSLPNWTTELGSLEDGAIREVNLTGTGLSDALIDRLRRVEAPGMRFHFSRQATVVEDAFTSIDAAISFWRALVEDAPLISLNLETGEMRDLINFLTRLQATEEYKNILARPVLAKRIYHVLKEMENHGFKERASLIIHEGLSTCNDRIISALDELDVMLQVKEAEERGRREKLRALGKGMLMLEEVQKAAGAHARTLTWVDEIEIQLAFQIALRDRLQLPLSTGHMIFRGCAHVSDEEIQHVGAEIERRVSEEMVDDYLLTWAPWQKLLRREAFDALNPELQEARSDLSWECCLSFDELTEGYFYKGNLYARDSLRRAYVDKGVDPFTNQPIDLAEVKKVVSSSVALKE